MQRPQLIIMLIPRATMEIIYFTPPEITLFIVGQVGSSCANPSLWQLSIIIGLVASSGVILASTGVGIAGIATTLVALITTGASLEAISTALGTHIAVAYTSMEILVGLISAIRWVLGC